MCSQKKFPIIKGLFTIGMLEIGIYESIRAVDILLTGLMTGSPFNLYFLAKKIKNCFPYYK